MYIQRAKVKHKLLIWCREDYTSLFSLFNFVKEFFGDQDFDFLKNTTLDIAKEALEQEIVKAGFLNNENKFDLWKEDIDKIIREIKYQWDHLNRDLYPHEIVWFDEAPKGMIEFERLNNTPEVSDPDPFYLDEK